MSTDEHRRTHTRPGSYAITTSALVGIFGITLRRAKGIVDRLPAEHLDRVGNERAIPVWLARREWPNTFRDWPDAPAAAPLVLVA